MEWGPPLVVLGVAAAAMIAIARTRRARGPRRRDRPARQSLHPPAKIGFIMAGIGLVCAWPLITLANALNHTSHGVVLFAPVSASALFCWPIAGMALAWNHSKAGKVTFVAIMTLQYAFALEFVADSGEGHRFALLWTGEARRILVFLGIYLATQAALWGVFVTCCRRADGKNATSHLTLGEAILAMAMLALMAAPIFAAARWILGIW